MYKSLAIKHFTAVLLLCLFAFSITPRQWLHDLMADHKDKYVLCRDGNPATHLHGAAFHCDSDNLVVVSPYLFEITPLSGELRAFCHSPQSIIIDTYCSVHSFLFKLRGPPSIG